MYDSKAPWARHMQKHIGEPGIEIPECKKIKYKKWQGHKSIEIQFALGPIDEENNNVSKFHVSGAKSRIKMASKLSKQNSQLVGNILLNCHLVSHLRVAWL